MRDLWKQGCSNLGTAGWYCVRKGVIFLACAFPDTPVNKVLSELKFEERKSTLQQKEKKDKKILPFVTQYHQAVPNLEKILSSKWHLIQSQSLPREMQRASHYLVQKRSFAQRYTQSIQTLEAKNTHLRTTGVVQACHNYLISELKKK